MNGIIIHYVYCKTDLLFSKSLVIHQKVFVNTTNPARMILQDSDVMCKKIDILRACLAYLARYCLSCYCVQENGHFTCTKCKILVRYLQELSYIYGIVLHLARPCLHVMCKTILAGKIAVNNTFVILTKH